MVFAEQNESNDEIQAIRILLSIIMLYGDQGLPLEKVEKEFMNYSGYPVPYKKFGSNSLRAWVQTLPDIFLLRNGRKEVLIQHSKKSSHLKDLISNQKSNTKYYKKRNNEMFNGKPRHNNSRFFKNNNEISQSNPSFVSYDTRTVDASISDTEKIRCERYDIFRKLESMLPLFYNHQALGDDFFLDIADFKFGYYVPENGPKECGLCISGQTISELTERVKNAEYIAPRVVVMIGFCDLLQGKTITDMIYDLKGLIIELKKKRTIVTLTTLIPSPKMPKDKQLEMRMEIFNQAIMEYSSFCLELKCNVIDMNSIFLNEQQKYSNSCNRFSKITNKDPYKVFSDYGRKVFLANLRTNLKSQIECEY